MQRPRVTTSRYPVVRHAMTLVEVMVAMAIALIVTGAGLMSLTSISRVSTMAAQYTTAVGLCEQRLEAIRAVDFDQVTSQNFPSEYGLPLTHTESPSWVVLPCDREVAITDEAVTGAAAKRVVVTVRWVFVKRPYTERIETVIYNL